MTVPNTSRTSGDEALQTGTNTNSTELEEQSRAASVPLIRSWPLSVLCLCFFPLLVSLGSWQLQRAEEKRQLLNEIDARLASQPKNIHDLKELKTYTSVRLSGFYSGEYFYLDNRTRNGRVGYEILQLFISTNNKREESRWLINRGWLPAGADRSQLPEVTYPLAAKVITGFLYLSEQNNPALQDERTGALEVVPGGRIQALSDTLNNSLSERLALAHPAWHIRLSADSDTALVTNWQLVNIKPQKHTGYAVQWFCMSAALLILWLLAATNIRELVCKKWFKKSEVGT